MVIGNLSIPNNFVKTLTIGNFSCEYTNMLDREMLPDMDEQDTYELEEFAEHEHSYLMISMSSPSTQHMET